MDRRRWKRFDALDKKLRPLRVKYANAAMKLAARTYDTGKAEERITALEICTPSMELVLAACQIDFLKDQAEAKRRKRRRLKRGK